MGGTSSGRGMLQSWSRPPFDPDCCRCEFVSFGEDRKGPPTLWHQRQLVQDPLAPVLDGRLVEIRKKPVHEGPAQTTASPQAVPAFRVQALERSRGAAHGLL